MTEPARIYLREFVPEDSLRLFEIESQPIVVRYQEFEARTLESARKYVQGAISSHHDEPRTYLDLVVCDQATDLMIGRVGASFDLGEAWIWYVIDPAYQGRGLAKEAVALFLERLSKLKAVKIECDPRNVPSWRLAESLGFKLVSERSSGTMIKGEDCGSKVYVMRMDA